MDSCIPGLTYGRARPRTVGLTGQADDQSEAFARRSHDIASCEFRKQCRLIEMAVIQTDEARALASCSASDDHHVAARQAASAYATTKNVTNG
jgi:hypothetical protein